MAWQLLATVAVTYLAGSFIGWLTHWSFHRPWSGRFHRAHMAHHTMYPRRAFLSDAYMSVGRDSGSIYFTAVIASAVLVLFAALWAAGLPGWLFAVASVEGAAMGAASGYVHDATHVRGHWLERFGWFERLRTLHIVHHSHARSNFGIYGFGWDRMLRTYRHVELYRNPVPLAPPDGVGGPDSQ